MQATAPDDGRPQRDMAAPTPPILRLNEDCIIKIAEHIAVIDYEYQRRREAGCTSGPPSMPPGPLIAFSMVNKAIREMTAPVVFRRAILTLDEHYASEWKQGLGVIDLHMGGSRFERTLRWPRDVIRHARSLCIRCSYYPHDHNSMWNVRIDKDSHSRLIPAAILDLLQTPISLKYLSLYGLPYPLLEDIKAYDFYIRIPALQNVEELVIPMGAEVFMHLCPNTKKLSITGSNGRMTRTDPIQEHNDAFFRYASALTKLTSLHLDEVQRYIMTWRIAEELPNLEELKNLMFGGGMGYYDAVQMITNLRRLRILTTNYFSRSPRDDHDNTEEGRMQLAKRILDLNHPTLQAVEIRMDVDEATNGYQVFKKSPVTGEVYPLTELMRRPMKDAHLKWHPANLR
ncbi:uncharacterized protein LTHEOB_6423 [Lasiodiplodia theobromae]|uniref:uncharacterized protein n=1 Tax=Lasiodiplodia theobromae TaxID=45133 RepID=UPI0015C38376|nr:uncharacterized protein LTHEOB_6423 [Lasiodiplodia theobromae]KAF4544305.1 hypothetical protein LTHEOB_6423 [Lasiodiplodia theobromae]